VCFQEGNEADVESILNSIVSILVMLDVDRAENLILAFSEKLTKVEGRPLGLVALRV